MQKAVFLQRMVGGSVKYYDIFSSYSLKYRFMKYYDIFSSYSLKYRSIKSLIALWLIDRVI